MSNFNQIKTFLVGAPLLMLFSFCLSGQTITKETPSSVSGTVCPVTQTNYTVSIPANFGLCKIKWTATNGVIEGADNQPAVKVKWHDTPGATAIIAVTFSGCESDNENEGFAEEKILSVKNQSWGSYGTSINVDYCSKAPITVTVPQMFVQGIGGIAQPPLTEAAYGWTLPAGWKEVGTGRTGFFGTPVHFVTIEPIDCAKPGIVTVIGTLAGGPYCTTGDPSATATISINGANPV